MGKKPIIVAVAILAIAASICWVYYQMLGRRPSIEFGPYQALGEIAAEEIARLLNHQGRIVIIAPENPAGANPVEEAQLKAFTGALKRGGLSMEALERFNLPPSARMFGKNVPREWFLTLLRNHPNIAALVLFAEFPVLEPSDNDVVKQRAVKIMIISGNRDGAQRLLDEGRVHAAIVPRSSTAADSSTPAQGTRGVFDQYYEILAPGRK